MNRKSSNATLLAVAASMTIMAVSAELSGANAQTAEIQPPAAQQAAEEATPVFVTEEIVQPLPEAELVAAEEDAAIEAPVPQAGSLRELVSKIQAPQELSRQMECLAGAIYFESRGEPIDGQLAVAQVVINRAESSVFPSDYCGVVYQRAQFSFVKNGSMPSIKRGSDAWKKAKTIAKIAHEGLWDSAAQDSLYFHASYVKPSWSYRKQARATINTHIFYR